jgi:hypothetical protein
LTVATAASPAEAQERVPLAWRFTAGQSFFLERTVKTDQRMRVAETDLEQTSTQTYWTRWTPQAGKDGNWAILVRIQGFRFDTHVGGNRIVYDSRNGPAPT